MWNPTATGLFIIFIIITLSLEEPFESSEESCANNINSHLNCKKKGDSDHAHEVKQYAGEELQIEKGQEDSKESAEELIGLTKEDNKESAEELIGLTNESKENSSVENSSISLSPTNNSKSTNDTQTKKANCLELVREEPIGDVEIVNATNLQQILQSNPNITNKSTPANCNLIYFFSPYCPFSAQGSAYVNALARSLPNITVYGLDSTAYHSINARYGIMGTPSLVLFHNGNVAGRYNASEYSTFNLESFIRHFTDQKLGHINVTSHDFKTNLPSVVLASPPYALYMAWAFLIICGTCLFLNSEFYAKLTEAVLNNWREAEAQHEHDE